MPPVAFTFLRYTVASVRRRLPRLQEGAIRLPHPHALRIVLLGGLGFGVYHLR